MTDPKTTIITAFQRHNIIKRYDIAFMMDVLPYEPQSTRAFPRELDFLLSLRDSCRIRTVTRHGIPEQITQLHNQISGDSTCCLYNSTTCFSWWQRQLERRHASHGGDGSWATDSGLLS